jgi:hypothetical protein
MLTPFHYRDDDAASLRARMMRPLAALLGMCVCAVLVATAAAKW